MRIVGLATYMFGVTSCFIVTLLSINRTAVHRALPSPAPTDPHPVCLRAETVATSLDQPGHKSHIRVIDHLTALP